MKITNPTRLAIIAAKRANPDISNAEIGRNFGINCKQVWDILRAANVIHPKSTTPIARLVRRQDKMRAIRAKYEAML